MCLSYIIFFMQKTINAFSVKLSGIQIFSLSYFPIQQNGIDFPLKLIINKLAGVIPDAVGSRQQHRQEQAVPQREPQRIGLCRNPLPDAALSLDKAY